MISDAHFNTDDALVNRFRDAEFSYRLAQNGIIHHVVCIEIIETLL